MKADDIDAKRTFFDPHPGSAGAAVRIPDSIRSVANKLDGQTMSLRDAVRKLEAVGVGRVSIVSEHGYIALRLGSDPNRARHVFRVIRYK